MSWLEVKNLTSFEYYNEEFKNVLECRLGNDFKYLQGEIKLRLKP